MRARDRLAQGHGSAAGPRARARRRGALSSGLQAAGKGLADPPAAVTGRRDRLPRRDEQQERWTAAEAQRAPMYSSRAHPQRTRRNRPPPASTALPLSMRWGTLDHRRGTSAPTRRGSTLPMRMFDPSALGASPPFGDSRGSGDPEGTGRRGRVCRVGPARCRAGPP